MRIRRLFEESHTRLATPRALKCSESRLSGEFSQKKRKVGFEEIFVNQKVGFWESRLVGDLQWVGLHSSFSITLPFEKEFVPGTREGVAACEGVCCMRVVW